MVKCKNIETTCKSIGYDATKKEAQKIMAQYEKELIQLSIKNDKMLKQKIKPYALYDYGQSLNGRR